MGFDNLKVKPDSHEKIKEIARYENSHQYAVVKKLVDHYYDIILEEMRDDTEMVPEPEIQQEEISRLKPKGEVGEIEKEIEGTNFKL